MNNIHKVIRFQKRIFHIKKKKKCKDFKPITHYNAYII